MTIYAGLSKYCFPLGDLDTCDSIVITSWWGDEPDETSPFGGAVDKCCQKCRVAKHVDLPASQWVYGTSKQHISEAVEVV